MDETKRFIPLLTD